MANSDKETEKEQLNSKINEITNKANKSIIPLNICSALVAFIIFSAIKLLKETRGIQIVKRKQTVGKLS